MTFCKYCGKQLEEGEVCACAQSQAAAQPAAETQSAATQSAAAAQNLMNDAVHGVKSYIPRYFNNPAEAVRGVVEADDMTFALVLTVLRVLATGLAVFGFLNKFCGEIVKSVNMAAGAFDTALGTSIKVNFFACILQGLLIALIGMGAFTLMVFALTRLMKGTASIKAVFEASACNGVLTTALLLVAFVCSFFWLQGCMIFLVLACITWMISGVMSAQLLCPNNASGKFWLLYIAGTVLVFVVGGWLIPTFLLNAIGKISVSASGIPSQTLEAYVEQFKQELASMGGMSGLLNSLMRNF